MKSEKRQQQAYDHRLREVVWKTGDSSIATNLGIPRSTIDTWLRQAPKPVISHDVFDMEKLEVVAENLQLRQRVNKLRALLRLLVTLLKVTRANLSDQRLPDGRNKEILLRAITKATKYGRLPALLRPIRLTAARYHLWNRGKAECNLDDDSSCPATTPQQITSSEVRAMKTMVTYDDYRHAPTGTLAILAQRLGKVFASPSTWRRLTKKFAWRRPRVRVHPHKTTTGLRTNRPKAAWHIDMTVRPLLDGSKVYLHAVMDNFSKRILSWRLGEQFDPTNTIATLLDAAPDSARKGGPPLVVADGGIENVNNNVTQLIETGVFRRVIAQTEVTYSNSMIEAWWRTLKHQWLFLNRLDTYSAVKKLIAYYVEQHNCHLPHSAFKGQTPDEMYFGNGDHVPEDQVTARKEARQARMEENRALAGDECPQSRDVVGVA